MQSSIYQYPDISKINFSENGLVSSCWTPRPSLVLRMVYVFILANRFHILYEFGQSYLNNNQSKSCKLKPRQFQSEKR